MEQGVSFGELFRVWVGSPVPDASLTSITFGYIPVFARPFLNHDSRGFVVLTFETDSHVTRLTM